jgi:hypothetical protein
MRALPIAIALTACGGGKDEAPHAPPIGPIVQALLGAADHAVAPWRCAAADLPGRPDETLDVGGHAWKLSAHTLSRADDDGAVVIGVVADAGGAAPRTIAALGRLRAALDGEKPDLVLALGGMGATSQELQATLGTLSDRASWPVIALPGDLEPTTAHVSAIAALRTHGDIVVDGRSVRWIELPGVTIGTLPGAGAAERLAAGTDGCAWSAADVTRLATELTARPGLRIVASAEAPRTTVDGDPAGELALVPSKALPVDIALHGPVALGPTPARSGGRDGAGVTLSPGISDATSRLPRPHRPSAGILVVRGSAWTWRIVIDASTDNR